MKQKPIISMQEVFFFLILIALSIAFFNIIAPFFADIFLTLILVILFKRPYNFFLRKFNNKKRRAASVTLITVFFLIVIPLTFIGVMITNEATENYDRIKKEWPEIQKKISDGEIEKYLQNIPVIGDQFKDFKIEDYQDKINDLIAVATEYSIYIIQNTFTGLASMLIHTFIILFLLYFMLIDGQQLIKRIQYLIPLRDEDEDELFKNIERVTDAIVFNSFMLGIIEGTYGGILFAILGIPSPVFWGFIMAGLSIIPLVGTNTVLVPFIIIYFIIGEPTTAILLLTLGTGVVLVNQNLVRPRLDGNKSGMHTAIVLLASLGGLIWMGVIGFLAGPLLMGLFITIWNQFGIRYQKKLLKFNKGD